MPLVNDYEEVFSIYRDAAARGVGLPVFCAEDRETLEAILASAAAYGERIGVPDLPIIPAWTSRYPARGQMTLMSEAGDALLGHRMMFSDLAIFAGADSPYGRLRIMPHLDHAFPWLDGDVLADYADRFASVMCDASEKPMEENIRLTADYVVRVKGRVVVEGAVDEIPEHGGAQGRFDASGTSPEAARRFMEQTGVDIIVPNVGTEHRAAGGGTAHYNAEAAQKIRAAVGSVMCLHGTSSVPEDVLSTLPGDGFVKINIYTTLAVHGGQAVARNVLEDLPRIFDASQLMELRQRGILGPGADNPGNKAAGPGPRLDHVANPRRRHAWFVAVRDRCMKFLDVLGYQKFATPQKKVNQ